MRSASSMVLYSKGYIRIRRDLDNSPKLQIAGLTSNVGTIKMKDVNGDGFVTNDDRTFIGNPTPKFIFGFTNDFQYRNFDLRHCHVRRGGRKNT